MTTQSTTKRTETGGKARRSVLLALVLGAALAVLVAYNSLGIQTSNPEGGYSFTLAATQ